MRISFVMSDTNSNFFYISLRGTNLIASIRNLKEKLILCQVSQVSEICTKRFC